MTMDCLSSDAITGGLRTRLLGRLLHILDETASTNTVAMRLGHDGAPHGAIVLAERQTAGRGRLGRSWHSPGGVNLYASILLRLPPREQRLARWLSWIPLITGVAAVHGLLRVSPLRASLKWPNDLLVGSRKLGGILSESHLAQRNAFVVVGLGVNVNLAAQDLPGELRDVATSVYIETGMRLHRASLLCALLDELEPRYERLVTTPDAVIEEYAAHCATLGREVRVQLAEGREVEGRAIAISQDGALVLVGQQSGRAMAVSIRAGDVMHLR